MEIATKIKILDIRIGTVFPVPSRQTGGSAGIDLMAMPETDITLMPGDRRKISSGISLHLGDPGIVGLIVPRSGLGSKGIVLSNLVGVIDSDYTGEVFLSLWNSSNLGVVIQPGMRVAQLLLVPVLAPVFQIVAEHEETERGSGGFGSTGHLAVNKEKIS